MTKIKADDYKIINCNVDIHVDGDVYVRYKRPNGKYYFRYIACLAEPIIMPAPNPYYQKIRKLLKK